MTFYVIACSKGQRAKKRRTLKDLVSTLWLVVAHDLLKYRCMDDVTRNLFTFVLWKMVRGFENVCEIISNKASESLEKRLAGAIYKEEK